MNLNQCSISGKKKKRLNNRLDLATIYFSAFIKGLSKLTMFQSTHALQAYGSIFNNWIISSRFPLIRDSDDNQNLPQYKGVYHTTLPSPLYIFHFAILNKALKTKLKLCLFSLVPSLFLPFICRCVNDNYRPLVNLHCLQVRLKIVQNNTETLQQKAFSIFFLFCELSFTFGNRKLLVRLVSGLSPFLMRSLYLP